MQRVLFQDHPQLVVHLNGGARYDRDPLFRQVVAVPDHHYDPAEVRRLLDAHQLGEGQRRVVTNERLTGNPGSGGFDIGRIARRIAAADPDARIIAVVREQGDLVRSTYRQMVRMGWIGPPERLLDDLTYRSPGFHLSQFEFASILDQYRELFSPERVLVLDYAQIRTDRAAFLEQLAAFMQIQPWTDEQALEREVNESRTPRQTRVLCRLNRYRRSEFVPFPRRELPGKVLDGMVRVAGALPKGRPVFSPELVAEIRSRFVDDNQQLAERYGIELRSLREG